MRGLPEVRAAAAAAGAAGTIISGAGPTLLSFCAGADVADRVAAAMRGVYAEIGLGARAQVAHVLTGGASWRAI
jgi:homoserine kinase